MSRHLEWSIVTVSDMPQRPSSPATPPPVPDDAKPGDAPSRSSGVVEREVRPRAEDLIFVNELSAAGLMDELHGEELRDITVKLGDVTGVQRKVDLLELYYFHASGNPIAGRRRRMDDRFFMHREEDGAATAGVIVERLAELAPEIPEVRLERIGDAPTDPLILRSGDHFAGVLDDYDEELDTGEIDIREIDGPSISVRGLVRALNILLDRHDVRERLVELRSDDEREVYVATTLAHAMAFCKAGILEEETPEEVMELAAW